MKTNINQIAREGDDKARIDDLINYLAMLSDELDFRLERLEERIKKLGG